MRSILRAVVGLICAIFALNSLVLVVRGVMLTVEAYRNLLHPDVERPLLPALEAVDMFFLALAFFIVFVGLAQLFIGDLPLVKHSTFAWLRIESFLGLKLLLWDTFLVTLLVLFVTSVMSTHERSWEQLVMPTAILMLTASSFLLKQGHK